MSSIRNQDTFIYIRSNEICDPLAAVDPTRFVGQSHKPVRISLDLIRYGFAGLRDGNRRSPIRALDIAPIRMHQY